MIPNHPFDKRFRAEKIKILNAIWPHLDEHIVARIRLEELKEPPLGAPTEQYSLARAFLVEEMRKSEEEIMNIITQDYDTNMETNGQ